MKIISDLGIQIPQVQLPRPGIDLQKWAVIACDQFTSEPDYWKQVEQIVGSAPSTLKLTFPEVYLEKADAPQRIGQIQASMRAYLQEGILRSHDGLILVERSVAGRTRKGIMLCLDLERYDFARGASSLIRASEGTIMERLPPRMKIREGAPLELPHILVLIDDPGRTVIEPVYAARSKLERLYEVELMLQSGHLSGRAVSAELEAGVIRALRGLAQPETFRSKYGLPDQQPVLLFATGDGNHSLATAKAVWNKLKAHTGMDHPARYALVEIENVHDDGLEFEPIHRVLFGLKKSLFGALHATFGESMRHTPVGSAQEMMRAVDGSGAGPQLMGLAVGGKGFGVLEIAQPSSHLAVGTIQTFLDAYLQDGGADKIDYVHGNEVVVKLGTEPGNAGLYLPHMNKSDLFKTVILDGALPRKTFSMGEAREKRFYMEARKIA